MCSKQVEKRKKEKKNTLQISKQKVGMQKINLRRKYLRGIKSRNKTPDFPT